MPSPAISLGRFPITGPLPVGADYWVTNTVILPVSQSGDYQLNPYADGGGPFFDLDTLRLANPQFSDSAFSVLAYGALGVYYTLQV